MNIADPTHYVQIESLDSFLSLKPGDVFMLGMLGTASPSESADLDRLRPHERYHVERHVVSELLQHARFIISSSESPQWSDSFEISFITIGQRAIETESFANWIPLKRHVKLFRLVMTPQ